MVVVPTHEMAELTAYRHAPERNHDAPRTVVLHSAEEPLDDGDAAMFAHGPVAQPYPLPSAPTSVSSRNEHAFLVANEVARCGPDLSDGATEESTKRLRSWLSFQHHPALNTPRVVVKDNYP